ncbi:MAG: hypothetical protein K8J31_21625 [Anaerolineae bacterium]|nr:hypothetical protein [Anaerolineae bacterium]
MRRLIRPIRQAVLNRGWYVHPERVLLIGATPSACLQTLSQAARPSTQRLHLRNLFSDGRRYHLKPWKDGFLMSSTSRVPWRRGRGRVAAVLMGTCSEIDGGVTRVSLRARLALPFLLDVFVLPGWMSLLLLFGPLPLPVGAGASLLLLALSWAWHWYAAVMQATEMIYFVQVALDDLPAAVIPVMASQTANTVYADFHEQWQKFYDEHRQ